MVLTTMTPTIAVPKASISISGTARNIGTVPISAPIARVLLGTRPLTSRQAVSDWSGDTTEQSLGQVARSSLGKALAPGAAAHFALTIPANAISHRDSFGVLPMRLDVVGSTTDTPQQTSELGGLNTFLPSLASVKAFEPLSIAWLFPLTLDPNPALHGMDSPARTAAWTKAIGPGSRLDRLIQGTQDADVTWAIDPAILGPRTTPTAAGAAPTPGPTATAANPPAPGGTTTPDPVAAATTALAGQLKAAAPRHTLWSLPYADPDLAALLAFPSGNRSLPALVSRFSILDVAVGPARTDMAWPVEGTVTRQDEAQLRRAFAAPRLAAIVTSASTLTTRNGASSDASRKTGAGLPLLAYDEALSRTVAHTSSKRDGVLTIQRFLADSMALLGERPGTRNRSVLIAEPRTFAGDPAVLRSLFAAVANARWLVTTSTAQLLAASQNLAPETTGVITKDPAAPAAAPPSRDAGGGQTTAPDPLSPGTSSLTPTLVRGIPKMRAAITGIASVLDDGRLFRMRWADAEDQLLSVRWRGHPEGPAAIEHATAAAVSAVSGSVTVAPSSVNFFADRGVLQVTVVNALAAPIHDVHLFLTPAQPRLRIEQQPGPLKIGAKSRTNVRLQVTAIAAGLVPIDAVLTTSNGTPLGRNARVNVRVQPTNTWIYWVLGGLAGLVLVLGTYRSLRRGSTRASRPSAVRVRP